MLGIVFVTTPIFKNACNIIKLVIPVATNLLNLSFTLATIKYPLIANAINSPITTIAPTNPSSSVIIAKIKSLCASGIYKYFCLLFPNPTPNNPPDEIAYKL